MLAGPGEKRRILLRSNIGAASGRNHVHKGSLARPSSTDDCGQSGIQLQERRLDPGCIFRTLLDGAFPRLFRAVDAQISHIILALPDRGTAFDGAFPARLMKARGGSFCQARWDVALRSAGTGIGSGCAVIGAGPGRARMTVVQNGISNSGKSGSCSPSSRGGG